ncbi:ABC transporter permease [Mycoplasmopsis primatum]|uniref:ABC transporter permease n=1 Tax=Mycoplasmopsis primatum TaxID=55604 RepID=UPI000496D50E|nr:ABC transporter permease [Mycoplasmopsis primatum]
MYAFFKMQLKIYFRLISSYITPIIIGAIYVFSVICMKIALNFAGISKLLNSNQYIELSANFCLIASFMICSFVTQTFFYRYKQEGIEYILYSKPIKRAQVFFTNVLASLIGSVVSILLLSIMFFFSQLIIPIKFTRAILSTLTFFAAGMLCSIFCLGLGALFHNFVDAKVFQIIVSVIPILSIMSLGFVNISQKTDVIQSTFEVANNSIALVPKNQESVKGANKAIDNLNKRITTQDDWLTVDQSLTKWVENKYHLSFNPLASKYKFQPKKTLIQKVESINNSFYSKIYWSNFKEYFFPLFAAYDKSLQNLSITAGYKDIVHTNLFDESNTKFNKQVVDYIKNKYDINLDDYVLAKTTNNDLLALGYNIRSFRKIFDWSIYEEANQDSYFNLGFADVQDENFSPVKEFNEKVIKMLVDKNLIEKLKQILLKPMNLLNPENSGFFNLEEFLNPKNKVVRATDIYEIIYTITKIIDYAHNNDLPGIESFHNDIEAKIKKNKESGHINDNKILEHLKTKVKTAIKWWKPFIKRIEKNFNNNEAIDNFIKAKFDTTHLSDIQKARLESTLSIIKKQALNALNNSLWTIAVFKTIGRQDDGTFASTIDTSNIIPYLSKNGDSYKAFSQYYKSNIFQIMKLNNNLIEFERKSFIEPLTSVGIILLFSATLIAIGYLVFERKNFK